VIDLIYDGYCDFCIRSLRVVKVFDRKNELRLVDGNDDAVVAQRYPALTRQDLETAMYAFADGIYYRGYDAFSRAFRALPLLRFAGWLMEFAPVRAVGLRVYDLVARNRRSFGCSSGVCKI